MNQQRTAPAAQAGRPAAARPAAPAATRPAAPAAQQARVAAPAARPAAPAAQAPRQAVAAARPAAPAAQQARVAAPAPVTRLAAPAARPVAQQRTAAPVQRQAPVETFEPAGFSDDPNQGFGEVGFDPTAEFAQEGFDPTTGFAETGEAFDPDAGTGFVDGEGAPGFTDDLAGFAGDEQFPTEEGFEQEPAQEQEYVPPVGAGEYLLKASAVYASFLQGEDGSWLAGDEGVTTNTKVVKVKIEPEWLQPVANKLGENWVVVDCPFLKGAVAVPVTSLLNMDKTEIEVAGPAYEEQPGEELSEPGFDGEAQAGYTQEQLDAVNAAYTALDNIRTVFGMP